MVVAACEAPNRVAREDVAVASISSDAMGIFVRNVFFRNFPFPNQYFSKSIKVIYKSPIVHKFCS